MGRRVEHTRLQPRIMPLGDRYHPLIGSQAMGSIAVGTVTEGYLARAAEVPVEGPHHAILERVRKRHTRFTSDEMRDLLMCVAERVASRHPGHKLFLGNLSRRSGGDIPWSVSHNNGRDADLAFLARTPGGRVAPPAFLYHFDRKLMSTDSPEPIVFDVAANWTMIKALLQCPKKVSVQKLFIANWLRYPILRYARAIKESNEIRYAAAALLRQPRRTSPHSDHLHLRIGCATDDYAEGCLDRSRAPAAAIGGHSQVRRRLPSIRKALASEYADQRAGAAYLCGLYHDVASLPRIAAMLRDKAAPVRRRAVDALVTMHRPEYAEAIDVALGHETEAHVGLRMMRALTALNGEQFLAKRLEDRRALGGQDGRASVPVRAMALQMLSESEDLRTAHAVVPLLADENPTVSAQAQRTLGRLLNRTTADLVLEYGGGVAQDGVTASIPVEPIEQMALWQRFLQRIPTGMTRDQVVLDGFQRRGLPIAALDKGNLDGLAVALAWEAPYSDNAARVIARAIDYYPELGRGSRAHPHAFWMPFLARRRMIDRESVARNLLAAEAQVARHMSVFAMEDGEKTASSSLSADPSRVKLAARP